MPTPMMSAPPPLPPRKSAKAGRAQPIALESLPEASPEASASPVEWRYEEELSNRNPLTSPPLV